MQWVRTLFNYPKALLLALAALCLLPARLLAAPGDIDLSFTNGTGPNGVVFTTKVRTNDNKIYIGGVFDLVNGNSARRIVRLTRTGAFDTTFATPGCESSVNTIELQPDLKCIIGGEFTSVGNVPTRRLARLNDDGSLDLAFTTAMGNGPDSGVDALALQADGKILLGGRFQNFNGVARNRLARVNADGSLDTGFSPGTGPDQPVVSIQVQNDGKSIVTGNFTTFNGVARAGIVRLNTDGSVDLSFNPGTGASGLVNGAIIQDDGKIIVYGGFNFFNGQARAKIIRLLTDGSIDTAYAQTTAINSDIRDAELLPSGKLLIVGVFFEINFVSRRSVARLDVNGAHDTLFNPGTGAGYLDSPANAAVNASGLDGDGKLVVVGEFRQFNNITFNFITRVETADPTPPLVITHPTNLFILTGSNATFAITASGTALLHYQWRFGGVNIAGATNTSITITNSQAVNEGLYSVVVSNTAGTATSSNASLTLGVFPFFVTPPQSITNVVGANVSFSVTAGGTTPLFYQWVFGGAALANQTNATLNLTNIQVASGGPYTIIVSNIFGAVTNAATLTVAAPPAITPGPNGGDPATGQPQSLSVVLGQNATFSANAIGSSPLTYQWRFAGVNIANATNASVTLTNVQTNQAGLYSVVVSNPFGNTTSSNATLTVFLPPTITVQPVSQTLTNGATLNLSVTATGSPTLTYQWSLNGTAIPGATAAALSLFNVQESLEGNYVCVVSNPYGTATSAAAVITVQSPPNIFDLGQPQPQTVIQGSNATFSVSATGDLPFTYQWRYLGTNIPGATANPLVLTGVQTNQAGNYSVVVSNPFGSATSSNALLTVRVPPFIITQPTPTNQTVVAGSNATITVVAGGDPTLTYQWRLNGVNVSGATAATLTLTAVQTNQLGLYSVVVSNPYGTVTSSNATLDVKSAPFVATQPQSLAVLVGSPAAFSVTAGGDGPFTYQWRFGGTNLVGATNSNFGIGSAVTNDAGLYSVVISSAYSSVTSSNATLTVNVPPTIITHPQTLAAVLGSNATFTVVAVGEPTLVYQWWFNGATIAGATAASLTLTNVQAAQVGLYSVVVTNLFGTATSSNATLTVHLPPAIVAAADHPQPQTVIQGSNATFSVTATGDAPLSYEWRFGGTNIAGATNNPLVLTAVQTNQAGNYSVVVSNPYGSVTSSNALLTVRVPPFIITQPVSQTVVAGLTVGFTVLAGGDPTLTYQWRFNGNAIAGATGTSLSLTNVQAAQSGDYSVVVTNPYGTATSANATLAVKTAPFVATQPQSLTVLKGTDASFSVTAGGDGPFTYQWRFGGTNIANATNATVTLTAVQTNQAGLYSVVITSAYGTITSSNATLRVLDPPVIIVQPVSVTALAGETVAFTVVATGRPTLQYQWSKNGTAITGATNVTLTLANVSASDVANYSVVVTNADGTATSVNATLVLSLRTLQVVTTQTTNLTAGTAISVPVALLAEGGENRVRGSIAYDTNKLTFISLTTPVGATLDTTNSTTQGRIGFDLTLPALQTFTAGSNAVLFLNFTVSAGVTQSIANVMLQGEPVTNQVLNASGTPLPCYFLSGAVVFKSLTDYTLRSQTGATEEALPILNPAGSVSAVTFLRISFFDLGVDGLGNAIYLINATGTNNGIPYILIPTTLAPAGTFGLNVEYYVSDRVTSPRPRLVVEVVTGGYPTAPAGTLLTPDRAEFHLGRFKIDFMSTAGKTYYIQYSPTVGGVYETSFPGLAGTGGRLQWVDTGPPRTTSLPTAAGTRFYRLLQVP
jgi:uncharacterized delta-60 repeat protein